MDARAETTVRLFHDAWRLLADLTELRRRLPDPNLPSVGQLPQDWNEFRSYATGVDTLRAGLRLALSNAVTGFELRKEWQIRDELLPADAKLDDPQAWLRRQLEGLGS